MIEILSYSFFQKALIWWIIMSIASVIIGSFVVIRRESNITHSISHVVFLWICVSLFFDWDYYLFWFISAILWSLLMYFIDKSRFITKDASREIVAQTGMWVWIMIIWMIEKLNVDVFYLLFWNILLINNFEIAILSWVLILFLILFKIFGKRFLLVSFSPSIAVSKWINTQIYNVVFLVLLSILIAIGIRIFGILLIWAFLVIPSNIWKVLWNNIRQIFTIWLWASIFSVISWLFLSYFLWSSAWSMIVTILVLIFLISLIWKNYKN